MEDKRAPNAYMLYAAITMIMHTIDLGMSNKTDSEYHIRKSLKRNQKNMHPV